MQTGRLILWDSVLTAPPPGEDTKKTQVKSCN